MPNTTLSIIGQNLRKAKKYVEIHEKYIKTTDEFTKEELRKKLKNLEEEIRSNITIYSFDKLEDMYPDGYLEFYRLLVRKLAKQLNTDNNFINYLKSYIELIDKLNFAINYIKQEIYNEKNIDYKQLNYQKLTQKKIKKNIIEIYSKEISKRTHSYYNLILNLTNKEIYIKIKNKKLKNQYYKYKINPGNEITLFFDELNIFKRLNLTEKTLIDLVKEGKLTEEQYKKIFTSDIKFERLILGFKQILEKINKVYKEKNGKSFINEKEKQNLTIIR